MMPGPVRAPVRLNTGSAMSNEAVKHAQQKRDIGMDRSIAKCGWKWREYALGFLEEYCRTHETVFVDDLWNAGLMKPKSPRGLGAVMTHAKRAGWIVPLKHDGFVLARPSVHSNQQLKGVWRSCIYAKSAPEFKPGITPNTRSEGCELRKVAEGPRCRGVGQGDLF